MGAAYIDLLQDRHTLLFQMQSYAACSDPEIQAAVRECYGALVKLVARLSGAEPYRVWEFFAHGMLLNVVASLDLDAIADRDAWAAALGRPGRADPAGAGDGARRPLSAPFFRFATE